MAMDGKSDDDITRILEETRTIAVVGASQNPARPVYGVMGFLIGRGYEVYPINPGLAGQELQGRMVYASLADVPAEIDMVDVFRNSEAAGDTIDEALALPVLPKTIWLQLGVINQAGFDRAEAKGVQMVMDRCPAIEAPRLGV
jgi:predicted CoA-binding protein